MVDDEILLSKRTELVKRKAELSGIKIPKMTRRELQLGIQTKPKRLEARRFRREILAQKKSYGEQITSIDRYLAEKHRIREPDEPAPMLTKPKVSLFHRPKLIKMKKRKRRYWLNGI